MSSNHSSDLLRASYFYHLPEHLIANCPSDPRDHSQLMVYDRTSSQVIHDQFFNLFQYLKSGDLLVFNNTKVLPVRLFGKKMEGSARVEVLLLKEVAKDTWEALLRPGQKMHVGNHIVFDTSEVTAQVTQYLPEGLRVLKFNSDVKQLLLSSGQMPIPPYIDSPLSENELRQKYQTVYAKKEGAVAAPTAGFHFTQSLLQKLKEQGIQTAELTLHVGLGTFRPVKEDDIRQHPMHAEFYDLSQSVIDQIEKTKQQGGRVIAVGTTVTRVLEGLWKRDGNLTAGKDEINLFIYPGFQFQVVDGLITNFHLPESTLLMLVAALIGREKLLKLYQEAIDRNYRFYSFGDGMLIL